MKEKTGGLDAEPERHFGLLTKNELERYNPPYYMRDELDTWYASKPEPDTSDRVLSGHLEHAPDHQKGGSERSRVRCASGACAPEHPLDAVPQPA